MRENIKLKIMCMRNYFQDYVCVEEKQINGIHMKDAIIWNNLKAIKKLWI